MITVATLIAAGIAPTQARLFAEPLAAACERFYIDTPLRIGAFVGECRVESTNFTALEENMRYSDPARILRIFRSRVRDLEHAKTLTLKPQALANTVYALKNGNGDVLSGHGWLYRARGLIGLTGLDNYTAAQDGLQRPYVSNPGLVALPEDACLAAAWFWHEHGLNPLADAQMIDRITRVINGPGMLHADLRQEYAAEAAAAFA